MFALFFSLYYAMFRGNYRNFSLEDIISVLKPITNSLGELITSIFNNVSTPMTSLGDILMATTSIGAQPVYNYLFLVAFILAFITSIGIVVVAVKGVKKAFGIFFGHIR